MGPGGEFRTKHDRVNGVLALAMAGANTTGPAQIGTERLVLGLDPVLGR
jgi:hypothetical protein